MKNIIFSILWICILITIFLLENRSFFTQYLENESGLEKYNLEKYSDSQKIFSWSLSKNPNQILLFNLANSFVKQAENEWITQDKIDLFTHSLEYYNQALEFSDEKFIQNNIDYVETQLEKYKKSENSSNNQEQQDDLKWQWQWEEEDVNQNNQSQWWDDTQNNDQEESWDNNSTQEESNNNNLTQEQIEELENYSKQLEEIEQNNQQFFNKNTPEENLFEKFSNDPFFQDEFNRWWEKDW